MSIAKISKILMEAPKNLIEQYGSIPAFCAYVEAGPLFDKCFTKSWEHNINETDHELPYLGDISLTEWERMTRSSYQYLFSNNEIDCISENSNRRVLHIYLPLYFWIKRIIANSPSQEKKNPNTIILGLSAPQGCGKTTLVNCLKTLFNNEGYPTCVLSLDDFYLPFEDQKKLYTSFPENKLLEFRGNAGTHDILLAYNTLKALKGASSNDKYTSIPIYDKAAHQGAGDQVHTSKWPRVELPLRLIILEGWMLGFKALDESHPNLKITGLDSIYQINHYLWGYDSIHQLIDAWIVMKIEDLEIVYHWREEAERKLRLKTENKGGMSAQMVQQFVDRYMPAYKTYLPELYQSGPAQWDSSKPYLDFIINNERLINNNTN